MEMDILEKCAYIKGLAEGLNLDTTKPEGKVINAILDLLSDLTTTVADIDDEVATLNDYVEEIDHDLGDAEEFLYGDDDECDCCDDDECDCCDDDCDCDCCDDDGDFMEAMCPNCGEQVCFDNEIDPKDLICPACGKPFSDK
ncbi:MAG: CD1247 N-terminal domain-containing protein [Eubacteriales bacterium]